MRPDLRKRFWVGVAVVVFAALALAGPSIIANVNGTAVASDGCGMGSSSGGCGTMGDTHKAGTGSMQMAHQGCAMLSGTVTAIDKRDGSVTVKIKPAASGGEPAKKALGLAKVGDALSLGLMLNKDGSAASSNSGTAVNVAKYTCPMHPEVTSDKPGKCSKCGMDLERVEGGQK
ncbi:MAG: hypothetical protein M1133_14325 [Armatimonadetes bacterium]|nr:hypothetical protein [Armatimonadota bacterium]